MSSSNVVVLGDLIEGALNVLHQESERPLQTFVGADALSSTSDTELTIADNFDRVSAPMLLELGQELVLVTGKTADPIPVYTVIRGYAGTPKSAHATGDVVLLEPTWSRWKIRNAILTCFRRTLNSKLPNLQTDQLATLTHKAIVEMPAGTVDINRVFYQDPITGAPHFIDGWDFIDDAGSSSSTGKMLTLNWRTTRLVNFDTNLFVTYQTQYLWNDTDIPNTTTDDPAEADTISVPVGAEELPQLYAAAYVLLNREMSRIQLDRTEEWTTEAAVRNGISMRLVQQAWTGFYAALDEARAMQNVPRRLRYRPRRGL